MLSHQETMVNELIAITKSLSAKEDRLKKVHTHLVTMVTGILIKARLDRSPAEHAGQ